MAKHTWLKKTQTELTELQSPHPTSAIVNEVVAATTFGGAGDCSWTDVSGMSGLRSGSLYTQIKALL